MERKRSFQSKMEYRNRFERCKTPMGSVPISVIMGFDYPLEDASGRGENSVMTRDRNQESSFKTNYDSSYSSSYYTTQQAATTKQSYRTTGLSGWPSNLERNRVVEEPKKVRFARAATEARDLLTTSRDRYVRTSDTREHPLQQPCRYPAALSSYTSSSAEAQPSRFTRARTVGPPKVVSPWRQAGFPSSRTAHWGTSATSKTYYSSVRSRFL